MRTLCSCTRPLPLSRTPPWSAPASTAWTWRLKLPSCRRESTYSLKFEPRTHSSTSRRPASPLSAFFMTPWKSTTLGWRMRRSSRTSLQRARSSLALAQCTAAFMATSVLPCMSPRLTMPKPPLPALLLMTLMSLALITQCSCRPWVTMSMPSVWSKSSSVLPSAAELGPSLRRAPAASAPSAALASSSLGRLARLRRRRRSQRLQKTQQKSTSARIAAPPPMATLVSSSSDSSSTASGISLSTRSSSVEPKAQLLR
mmetsp:Transcript_17723/g.54813  ORF Transcript_17723/g.54813 Transcript_17723/m.54813 type:complete len:257 (-) Transcript_17723:565-1335(-)